MTFDISETLAPKSDQLDAIELLGQPRTFTVTNVTKGNAEQPVEIHLAEFPRPWRPSKSMRRVLAACWGAEASAWTGRRMTLYCDETVRFGSEVVGGTRISALSHIPKRKSIPLLVTKGRSAMFTVEPLPDAPPPSDGITAQQTARLTELFNDAGIERAARIGYCSERIGRDITKPADLSRAEADVIIDALAAMLDPADDATLPMDGAE